MLLHCLSGLYQVAVALRHLAYDYRLLPVTRVPAVVISIGNIVAGGVGKTPLVHFLAELLSKKFQVAILSRGYKSKAEHRWEPARVHSSMDVHAVGDEPLWLAQKLPHVQVWVGKKRARSAQEAVKGGAEVIILDDGFQHRKLHRDFDVVIKSDMEPTHFLPRGTLRDHPSRLEKASLLVSMKHEKDSHVRFKREIATDLSGKKVAVFCAIANPHRFIEQVEAAGGIIVASQCKSDHMPFTVEEIESFYKESGADCLICTEKDAIKLPSTAIPIIPIPLMLSLAGGETLWQTFIDKIHNQVDYVRRVSGRTP